MEQISLNTERFDPYKNFKFRVKWDGRYVAGVSKVTGGLKHTIDPIEHREGGDPRTKRKSPGPSKYEPIILERGATHDPEFERWANMVHNFQGDAAMSLKNFRKDIILELLNERGIPVMVYNVFNCWVSEFQVLPDLDAGGISVVIQTLKLENEGWERDESIERQTERYRE